MGKTHGPYKPEYPAGTQVQIVAREALEAFAREWKWHHPLEPHQLSFAGQIARVNDVTFYHGGDELYQLEGVPGLWHEENLRPS